jgi:hypothetical protein
MKWRWGRFVSEYLDFSSVCVILLIFKLTPDRETEEALGPSNKTDLSEIKGHQGIFILVFIYISPISSLYKTDN